MAAGRRRPSEASPSNNAMAADGALKLKHEHRSIHTDSGEGQKKVNMQHTGESPSSQTSRRFCLRTNSDNSSNPLSLATSCHRKTDPPPRGTAGVRLQKRPVSPAPNVQTWPVLLHVRRRPR